MSKVSTAAKSRAVISPSHKGRASASPVPGRRPNPARGNVRSRPGPGLSHNSARSRIRSARPLHRRLLMHPLSIFGLLLVGACLAGLTYTTLASDYTVTATVAAPPLTMGASITSPSDGAIVTGRSVTVVGNCPNEAYVKLFRNTVFSGVAICHDGVFSIRTDLFPGKNILQAQDYTVTDMAGPVTDVVTITYQLPSPVPSAKPGSPAAADSQSAPPLIVADYRFSATTTDQNFMTKLQFQGGQQPFAVNIAWGDKTASDMKVTTNDPFTISHHYAKPGYYTVLIHAVDADGRQISVQLVSLVRRPGDAPIRGAILSTGANQPRSTGANILHWLAFIWPTYVVLIAMMISFWLGERREYLVLTKAAKRHRPRLHHT